MNSERPASTQSRHSLEAFFLYILGSLPAFPGRNQSGAIAVDYASKGENWKLSVEDDGVGTKAGDGQGKPGLGTGIVDALAKQLDASVTTSDTGPGTKVSVVHST